MISDLSEPQQCEIRDQLNAGRKLAAIKLYREFTQSSLMESKTAVERFARDDESCEVPVTSDGPLDDRQMDEILDAVANGRKLNAVKLHMTSSGQSLSESKAFVESLMEELGDSPASADTGPRTGCLSLLLLAGGLTMVFSIALRL